MRPQGREQSWLCSAGPERQKDVAGSAYQAAPLRGGQVRRASTLAVLRQRKGKLAPSRSPGRSFLKAISAVFPSFSGSFFAVKPSSQRLLFYCAAASVTPLSLPLPHGCRIGTAQRAPHLRKEIVVNTACRFIHRHTRNTLVARGWPTEMNIQTRLSYSQETAWRSTAP